MRRVFLLFVMFAFSIVSVFSQRVVTGTVTNNEDGEGLPGVTVIAKGTSEATMTDLSGAYSINVPEGSTKLIFSFVGFVEVEKDVADVVNVSLKSDTEIEEVVVTALGIKRDVKALGYSATTVKSDELTRTKDRSALNALQGKVAGVNITSASSAPGSSTRVIMRGFSSITGSNQPLFIIDGVPVDNTASGSSSINGGTDFGNGINDINPDDIENITVLKGASGAALYGSRAANGVILITTKSGKSKDAKKGLEITVNSTATFESILRLPDWQGEYGQGFFGSRDIRENTSWGPKFDDEMRYWGFTLNGQRKIKPYSNLPDNVLDFFDIGKTYNNSISFAGGDQKNSFYASYSNINSDGIMPQDHDIYDRHTLKISGKAALSNNFTISGNMNYIKKQSKYVSTGQGAVSVYNQILQIPRDIPITELEDYESQWNDLDHSYAVYNVNPYLTLNKFGNENNQDRVFGSLKIQYQLDEHFSTFFRIGSDITNEQRHVHEPILDPHHISGAAPSWVNSNVGSISESSRFRRIINTDFIATYSNEFENIKYNVMFGHNMNQTNSKTLYESVTGLDIPDYYNLNNSGNVPFIYEGEAMKRLIGAYMQSNISFYDMVYLTATFRRDWSSTLPSKNNAYNYPGVNVSFDFTSAFPVVKKFIEFGKIRAGWAKVGRDAPAYQVHSIMSPAGFSNGYTGTGMQFPMADGLNAYTISNRIGNPDLSPEFVTEFEIGTDLRFFKGRVNVDFSYFNQITTDLIFSASMPYSSGYSVQTINFGKLQNSGFETLVSVMPIKKDKFSWKIDFNFTKNYSKVLELPKSLENAETGEKEFTLIGIGLPATGYTSFSAFEGEPLAIFTVNDVERVKDENSPYFGNIIVDSNTGLPKVSSDIIKLGDSNYDYTLGIGNSLTYKSFNFSFNIDIRQGGLMYSRTAEMTYFSGTTQETINNDRQPFIIPGSVVEIIEDGSVVGYEENDLPVMNNAPNSIGLGANMHEYYGNGMTDLNKKFVIDKSFIKLRDMSLSYSLPKKWLNNVFIGSMSVSIIGRNLLLWTPEENRWIDPEATSFGNDLTADYGEYGTNPSVRSVGFNLKFTF